MSKTIRLSVKKCMCKHRCTCSSLYSELVVVHKDKQNEIDNADAFLAYRTDTAKEIKDFYTVVCKKCVGEKCQND